MPKEITHIKQFSGCENLLSEFYNVCEMGLKEKLACVLFQFPPSYYFTSERLQQIIRNLDLKFKNVIEFRHKSWWNQEVWDTFLENNITFCSVSHPQLPQTIFKNFPLIYIRLHGTATISYDRETIKELYDPIVKVWMPDGEDDPNLSVITVTPEDGYYWNNKNGKIVAIAKMTAAFVTGKVMDDGIEGNLKL